MDESLEIQTNQAVAMVYRYPGFQPFQDNSMDRQLFFGREVEKEQLLHKILARRLVVIYAKSGMGKTSLLNAGIYDQLRSQRYLPLVVRFHESNKLTWDLFYEIVADEAEKYKRCGFVSDWYPGDRNTLWEYFKTVEFWSAEDDLLTPVLILDQFEELFTRVTDVDARHAFITQLSDLVRGRMPLSVQKRLFQDDPDKADAPTYSHRMPELKTIIAIREAHYGQLQALAKKIPEIFDSRFRLEPLNRENARKAITEPARKKIGETEFDKTGFTYSDEAVDAILDFLCSGNAENENSHHAVEPHQLQQLCRKIAAKAHKKDDRKIQVEDLGGEQGMQRILQDFYDEEMARLPVKIQKSVRNLIEDGLISRQSRIRIPLHGADINQRFGVSDQTLNVLIERRLLRSEQKRGGYLYELSHDTLIKPILDSRAKRNSKSRDKQIAYTTLKWAAMVLGIVALVIGGCKYATQHYFMKGLSAEELEVKIKALNTATRLPGGSPNAHLELAKVYLRPGKTQNTTKAIEHLNTAVREDTNYHQAYFLLANEYAKSDMEGWKDNARKNYEKATSTNKNNSEVYYAWGLFELNRGSQEDGFLYLKNAVDRNPQQVSFYFAIADERRKRGMTKELIDILEEGIENNPYESRLYTYLANEYYTRSNYKFAADRYEKGLQNDKHLNKDSKIIINLASCYAQLKNYPKAIDYYSHATELIESNTLLHPQQRSEMLAPIHLSMANMFLDKKELLKAISEYKQAIKNNAMLFEAFLGLSTAYQFNNQPVLAMKTMEEAGMKRLR
jgi:tetratricopeptide (TPR) repeat protein